AAATSCSCRGRPSALAAGPRIATPACAHWRCCPRTWTRRPAMAEAQRGTALDPQARAWTLAAAASCLLPLLLQLPGTLAIGLAAVAAVVGVLSWRHRLPAALRLVLSVALVALVLVQSGPGFGRDTGCALLAAMLALKPMELATLRDGRSLLGF